VSELIQKGLQDYLTHELLCVDLLIIHFGDHPKNFCVVKGWDWSMKIKEVGN